MEDREAGVAGVHAQLQRPRPQPPIRRALRVLVDKGVSNHVGHVHEAAAVGRVVVEARPVRPLDGHGAVTGVALMPEEFLRNEVRAR